MMRMTRWLARPFRAACLSMTLLAQPVWADDETAENRVGESVVALGDRRLDEALRLLERAESEAKSSAMLAKVERQRAFVLLALDRADDALAALLRARRLDPALRIGTRGPSRALQSLFDCAGALAAESRAPSGKVVGDGLGGWTCPAERAPKVAVVVDPPSVPAPRTSEEPTATRGATPPAIAAITPPPPVEEGRVVPAWSWILGGVAVVSAGAGGAMGGLALDAATDHDAATSAGGLSVGANVAFGIAGAALIGGALVWLVD